jgi:hypothetical protein
MKYGNRIIIDFSGRIAGNANPWDVSVVLAQIQQVHTPISHAYICITIKRGFLLISSKYALIYGISTAYLSVKILSHIYLAWPVYATK